MNKVVVFALATLLVVSFAQPSFGQEAKRKKKRKSSTETEQVVTTTESRDTVKTLISLTPKPLLKVKEEFFNFGEAKQGEIIKHTFEIENAGSADLLISSAKPSCGCTLSSWTQSPIAPGGKGTIDVSFNTAGKMGPQSKTITIYSNSEPMMMVIYLKGEVISPVIPNSTPATTPSSGDKHP